jgi:hypothetical protein
LGQPQPQLAALRLRVRQRRPARQPAVDLFNGTGSQTAFTLSANPTNENNTSVYISGVYQQKNTYAVSGTTLTFSTAPPSGTGNVEVMHMSQRAIETPADGSVTYSKFASGLVDIDLTAVSAADDTIASAKAIKTYVDAQIGSSNELSEILANGNTSGGTNIVVSSGDSITTDTIAETTAAAGVTIDGVLVKDGQVDGRDVSVDGTKLDGIEAGADVTDTTNVTAAGALMDSELTNITAVKALDQGVATTDSPSFAGLTATTADINGGTIDGAVIGGASAAAGTFTTLITTGNAGIGTSSAGRRLEVSELDQVAFTGVRVNNPNGNVGSAGVEFQVDPTYAKAAIFQVRSNANGNGDLVFAVDTNADAANWDAVDEKVRITTSGYLQMGNAAGPALLNEAATSTNPTLVANRADPDTGIGWNAADELSVIAGGTEVGRWFNSGLLMYGQLRVPDGTVSSGGLAFYNDLDTGIYRPAADVGALVAGGSEALRWNANGIGIGGATPTNLVPLNMSGASAGNNYAIRVGNTSTDGYSSLQLGPSGDAGLYRTGSAQSAYGGNNSLNLLTVGAHNIALGTANAVRWTVDGTTGDFSGINAAGPSLLNEAATATNPTIIPNKADPDTGMGWVSADIGSLVAGGSQIAQWSSDGIQMAATYGPALRNVSPSATVPSVLVGKTDTDTGLGSPTGDNLSLITGGTERVRIDSSGQVSVKSAGIDVPSGQGLFYAPGTGNAAGLNLATAGLAMFVGNAQISALTSTAFEMNNAAGPSLLNEGATSSNPTIIPNKADPDTGMGWVSANIGALVAGGVNVLNWNSSGNVGINTSTLNGTLLVIDQKAVAAPSSSGNMNTGSFLGAVGVGGAALNIGHDADGTWYNSAYFNNAGVARIHRWLTGGTERMRIDSSGNLEMANAAGPSLLNEAATGSNPTLIPNKAYPTNGIGANNSGTISIIPGGTESFRVTATALQGVAANAPIIKNETPTSTNPVFVPSAGDPDTGMGWNSTNIGSLVAGGTETLRWSSTSVLPGTDANDLGSASLRWDMFANYFQADGNAIIGTNSGNVLTLNSSTTFGGNISGANAAGPALLNEAATNANPTVVPNKSDPDTGIAWNAANDLSLVAGAATNIRINSTTGSNGGTGSAGAGNQYVELNINGNRYKLLHDGTI